MPERFDLSFINEKSEEGASGGHSPRHLWLTGTFPGYLDRALRRQLSALALTCSVKVIPVAEAHFEAAQKINDTLRNSMIRSEIDTSNDSFGKEDQECQDRSHPLLHNSRRERH